MPQLLYLIAEEADGRSGSDEIAARVSERFGRGLTGDDVAFLVEKKLRPLGVLAQADGSSPKLEKPDPLLALKFRAALVSERAVHRLTTLFYPFFFPLTIVAVVGALIAVDVWLFFIHGVGQSTRDLVYNPLLLLMVFGLVVLATALHEIGHATAARYGGAKPGVMGAGIYIVWPAFYTDVTDAYRLGRWGRVRTDLGGIFFNGLFAVLVAGAYAVTSFEPLLVLILLQHFQVFQQLLPLLRLDGYYILSDLTGVPDLFMRIKPTLESLIPGREASDRVKELKPWVRVVVTGWVIVLVPFLLFIFGMMMMNAPRVFATAWDSFLLHLDEARGDFGNGKALNGTVSGLQMGALALPAAGMAYSFTRAGARGLKGAWSWSAGSVLQRGLVVLTTIGAAALLAFIWWPNGDYKPIQPGERGTLPGAVAQFSELPTGRPALTPEREQELGGAPFKNDDTSPAGDTTDSPTSTSPSETTTGPTDATSDTTGTSTEPTNTATDTTSTSTEPTTTTTTTDTTTTTTP